MFFIAIVVLLLYISSVSVYPSLITYFIIICVIRVINTTYLTMRMEVCSSQDHEYTSLQKYRLID